MSDMDYEKAWKHLKSLIGILSGAFTHLAESEDQDDDERLRVEGGKIMARRILRFMDDAEKEITTIDWEKAWRGLKGFLMYVAVFAHLFAEYEKNNAEECLKAKGGEMLVVEILKLMDDAEKEMTTVGKEKE